ncbi:PDGLE domain-containing protein [Svornostia abyssi]|uniref:PDGLE domain-containing protein n=1 Tax=Svornostia abyssi TaxID=2898438 RepID=A0ABY5PAP7_9ACTN|nr:PDGLE domain-containing protein [Parviterribacteraceae bacterium J379]
MRLGVFVGLALAVAIGLGAAVSPFASPQPDGLERVAEDHGFTGAGTSHAAPVADYAFPGVTDEKAATAAAGLAGTLLVFALGAGLAVTLRRRSGHPA